MSKTVLIQNFKEWPGSASGRLSVVFQPQEDVSSIVIEYKPKGETTSQYEFTGYWPAFDGYYSVTFNNPSSSDYTCYRIRFYFKDGGVYTAGPLYVWKVSATSTPSLSYLKWSNLTTSSCNFAFGRSMDLSEKDITQVSFSKASDSSERVWTDLEFAEHYVLTKTGLEPNTTYRLSARIVGSTGQPGNVLTSLVTTESDQLTLVLNQGGSLVKARVFYNDGKVRKVIEGYKNENGALVELKNA